jgi:hypothetical protein
MFSFEGVDASFVQSMQPFGAWYHWSHECHESMHKPAIPPTDARGDPEIFSLQPL